MLLVQVLVLLQGKQCKSKEVKTPLPCPLLAAAPEVRPHHTCCASLPQHR